MYKGITNYKLLGAYVAKIIGYTNSTIHFFFSRNSFSLNIFSTREDSTVKTKTKKCLQEGAFGKKNYYRGASI